ncbi:hypothetical protein L195_g041793, partial [Trifolium pratense]
FDSRKIVELLEEEDIVGRLKGKEEKDN